MFLASQLGNISQDPVLRTTANGTAVLNFSVASNDRRGGKDSPPIFMQWSLFGKQAEGLKPYLWKGMKIFVTGTLQMNNWTGQDGQARSGMQGMASRVEMLSPKKGNEGPPPDGEAPPENESGYDAPPQQPHQRPPTRQARPPQPQAPQYDGPVDF